MCLLEFCCGTKYPLFCSALRIFVLPHRSFSCLKNRQLQLGSQRLWLDKFINKKRRQRQSLKGLLERGLHPRTNAIRVRVLKSGAFNGPKSVVIETDHKFYLFNCGAGTQRTLEQCNVSIIKLEDIFLTHKSWENTGGLFAMLMTRYGVLMGKPEGFETERHPLLEGMIKLHGPPQVEQMIQITTDTQSSKLLEDIHKLELSNNSYTDFQIDIEYVLIPKFVCSATKESHDRNMQDTDIAIAYIIRPKEVWMPDISKLIALGIERRGPWELEVLAGRSYTLDDGKVINREDICQPPEPVPPVVVLDCPSEEHLKSVTTSEQLLKLANIDVKPQLIVHMSPADVVQMVEYQAFMNRFETSDHLLVNKDSKHSVVCQSVAFHQRLNSLHPGIFPDLASYRTYAEHTKTFSGHTVQGEANLIYYLRPYRRYRPGFDWDECFMINKQESVEKLCKYGDDKVEENVAAWKEYLKNLPKPANKHEYPEVVFLGTGSTFPRLRRTVSAVLLHLSPEKCMLLDCGEDTVEQIRTFYDDRADEVLRKLEAVFISHDHTDHHLGLCGVISARHKALHSQGLPITKLMILGTENVKMWLDLQLGVVMPGYQGIEYIQHEPDFGLVSKSWNLHMAVLEKLGLMKYIPVKVKHIKGSYGVSLVHRTGWKLVYSGDTLPCKELVRKGMGCDLLIHEATFSDNLKHEALAKMHCTVSDAIRVSQKMEAKFTILTHFSQRYHTYPILPEEMPENIAVAFDLMKVTLDDLPVLAKLRPVFESVFHQYIQQTKLEESKALEMLEALNKESTITKSQQIKMAKIQKLEERQKRDHESRKRNIENLIANKKKQGQPFDNKFLKDTKNGDKNEFLESLQSRHVKKKDKRKREFDEEDYSELENILENLNNVETDESESVESNETDETFGNSDNESSKDKTRNR